MALRYLKILVKIKILLVHFLPIQKKIVNTMQDSSKVKKVKSSKSKTSTESGFNKNPSQELKMIPSRVIYLLNQRFLFKKFQNRGVLMVLKLKEKSVMPSTVAR